MQTKEEVDSDAPEVGSDTTEDLDSDRHMYELRHRPKSEPDSDSAIDLTEPFKDDVSVSSDVTNPVDVKDDISVMSDVTNPVDLKSMCSESTEKQESCSIELGGSPSS